MLKLPLLDFFILGIPESFLSILIIYSLGRKRIIWKSYFLLSILLAIVEYSTRMLPINFGVHTMLDMLLIILLAVYVIKIPVLKAVSYTIVEKFIIVFSEVLLFTLMNLFKIDISNKTSSTLIKDLYEFPYLIFIGLAVIIIRKIRKPEK